MCFRQEQILSYITFLTATETHDFTVFLSFQCWPNSHSKTGAPALFHSVSFSTRGSRLHIQGQSVQRCCGGWTSGRVSEIMACVKTFPASEDVIKTYHGAYFLQGFMVGLPRHPFRREPPKHRHTVQLHRQQSVLLITDDDAVLQCIVPVSCT